MYILAHHQKIYLNFGNINSCKLQKAQINKEYEDGITNDTAK